MKKFPVSALGASKRLKEVSLEGKELKANSSAEGGLCAGIPAARSAVFWS